MVPVINTVRNLPRTGVAKQVVRDASIAAAKYQVLSRMTLTPGSAFTTNGVALAPIRGQVILTAGKTLNGNSFVTSVNGRLDCFGTVDIGSGDLAAGYFKADFNGSTLTSGHIAALQANIVNPAGSIEDLLYMESASGTPIHAVMEVVAGAHYLMDLTEVGGAGNFIITAAVGGSQSKKLKVKINGTDFFIPLNTA